ncbi:sensor histidine kinase [Conexibacter sp. DBS9H8]|uniref:sensor histidine kinase n=1 Tax=Conexibacter sp. DBS9H8 TaxID=2937801 RepID=UPI00200F5F36|nr:histidine kinase [Conexibacter sp. DBS9H8]
MTALPPGSPAQDGIPGLELLVEVLSGASSDLDNAGFYSHLAAALCRVADVRRAIIFRYDEATHQVGAVGAHGIALDLFTHAHISLAQAPEAARALAEDRVVEIRPPAVHDIAPEFASLVGDHALIYIPMAAAGRWPGVIIAEPSSGAAPLDAGRRDLLWTLGKTLALASAARIATFNGERARELQERIDLAREIHDGVAQRVFGVLMALSKGPVREEIRVRCESELTTALEDLRVALQRPLGRVPRLTGTTLAAELARLPFEVPDLTLTVEGTLPPVPPRLEALMQSVLTEAVRNVRKHAAASALLVRLTRADGALVLEVENDGVGERRAPGPPGMGLRLAALEALQLGGVVEFGERVPGTWRVRLAVPEREP